jgi:hypothetical protein
MPPRDIEMRDSVEWQKKHKEPQTELVMFDPAEPTNTVLLSVLERYSKVDGFDNTLARVLIENKRRKESEPT